MPSPVVMHKCNSDIKVHCWIVIPLMMQQVAIQLQLLVCNNKAGAGILFGKVALNQLDCWQDNINTIVYS